MQLLSFAACLLAIPAATVLAATQASTTPIPSATIGTCADGCLTSGAKGAGCGSFKQSTFGCLCKSGSSFSNSTTSCIQQSCQGADLAETEFIIQQVCAQASSSVAPSTSTPTRPAGGSVITTDPTASGGASDSGSISLLPTTSFSFTGSGFPTPVPVSSSSSGNGSTSGSTSGSSSDTSAAASSTGAALGRAASLAVHQAIWIPMLMTAAGLASGACYVLF